MSGWGQAQAAERDVTLLKLLTRCAEAGQPAPSNVVLAERLGLARPNSACLAIQRLEARGLIKVERFGMSRIVTIVETGKSTAGERKLPHWTRRDGTAPVQAQHQAKAADAPVQPQPVRVNRDPCPFCEVRADIGCRHSRAPRRITFVPVSLHAAEVAQP